MSLRRLLFACILPLALGACRRAEQATVEVPRIAAIDTEALQKLVQGVDAAKDQGGRGKARGLLEQAIAKDSNLWEARYNLGVILANEGKLEGAEEHLAQAYVLAPNAEDVVMALCEVRRRRGDGSAAAADLSAFISKYPDAIAARVLLVAALRDSEQFAAAIDQAREVLVRQSSDANALSELALTYLEQGELDTAELLSEEALKVEPLPAVAERTAGLIALRRGDDAVAFRHFVKASEIDPKDTTARVNMGTVLLRAGIADRAAKEFRAVLAVDKEDAEATLGLAAAVRGQGRRAQPGPYEEAKRLLSGLREREPGHLAATFNLAVLEADFLAHPAEARTLFEQYLADAPKAHPGRAYADKRLGELKASSAPPVAAQPAAPAPAQ